MMKAAPEPPRREEYEDQELVRLAVQGDRTAFDELVRRYRDSIYNLCYWSLGDSWEADDQAQEVFVKAFRSLKSFRSEAAFSTWLYRIGINTCKNRRRSLEYRFKKWTSMLEGNEAPGLEAAESGCIRERALPERELLAKERALLIQNCIRSLSSDRRSVVILRDVQGLSYEEIAAVTGYALGTVKSKLARAREDLRKQLKDVL